MEHDKKCLEKVKSLAVQGKILELAAAESTDFTWKSFVYDLRKGTLKFLANAHIDTLPTAANLKRWKKSSSEVQTVQGAANHCTLSQHLQSGHGYRQVDLEAQQHCELCGEQFGHHKVHSIQ